MPLAVRVDARRRANFYRSYLGASLRRDVTDLSRVRQIDALPPLMERLAAQTGQVLNIVKASNGAGLEPRSGDNYVRLLEALFLIRRLPAWGRTLRSRTAHSPKLHVVDSGLAAYLLGITPEKLARRDPAALAEFGHLISWPKGMTELLSDSRSRPAGRSTGGRFVASSPCETRSATSSTLASSSTRAPRHTALMTASTSARPTGSGRATTPRQKAPGDRLPDQAHRGRPP
jgi:hypothetical protein